MKFNFFVFLFVNICGFVAHGFSETNKIPQNQVINQTQQKVQNPPIERSWRAVLTAGPVLKKQTYQSDNWGVNSGSSYTFDANISKLFRGHGPAGKNVFFLFDAELFILNYDSSIAASSIRGTAAYLTAGAGLGYEFDFLPLETVIETGLQIYKNNNIYLKAGIIDRKIEANSVSTSSLSLCLNYRMTPAWILQAKLYHNDFYLFGVGYAY